MLIPGARSAHERRDEAQDPRQSRSDTSPPISQATARPPIGRRRETTRPIFLRETETGTKLSLLHAPSRKSGQNSPCTGKTARIPRFWASRGNFVTEMPQRPCAWRILSRTCPEVRALGEFCHGHAPKSARLANFVTDMPRSSSTGHVLSGHKLYARTFTHWLIRPPATPSMGRHHTRGQRGLAAVPAGGGGAWPGFEIDHSEPKARVWRSRGRAAAHGHTQQPGRGHGQPTGTHSSPAAARAHKAARPWPRAAHGHTQQPGGCTST